MVASEYTELAYARLGNASRAIDTLRTAPYRTHWGYVSAATLAVDPSWAALRGKPGYQDLRAELQRSER